MQGLKYEPMLKLKFRRMEIGMTQVDLAQKCNVTSKQISLYERGRCFPRRQTLNLLAHALGCKVQDII